VESGRGCRRENRLVPWRNVPRIGLAGERLRSDVGVDCELPLSTFAYRASYISCPPKACETARLLARHRAAGYKCGAVHFVLVKNPPRSLACLVPDIFEPTA
jgi:hypothetical protein